MKWLRDELLHSLALSPEELLFAALFGLLVVIWIIQAVTA